MAYVKYESLADAFWSNVAPGESEACWEWGGCRDADGYGVFQFQKKQYRAHRVSYLLHFGEPPEGMCVCHDCDNPSCVNPAHFFAGTNADNTADRDRKGRTPKGEGSSRAKLTESDVLEIREMAASGRKTKEMADKFGVSYFMIGAIAKGDFWKHVGGPLTVLKLAGSRIGQSKLTESQVVEIRRLVANGLSKSAAARRFGVSKATIIRAVRFESWKHI